MNRLFGEQFLTIISPGNPNPPKLAMPQAELIKLILISH